MIFILTIIEVAEHLAHRRFHVNELTEFKQVVPLANYQTRVAAGGDQSHRVPSCTRPTVPRRTALSYKLRFKGI
jgi:hypothetical protein